MLVEEQKADGTKAIVWKKVEDKKSDVQNVVIATKIENPNNAKFMSYMYYHPIVAVEDEKDPRIKYHLFGCSPQEDRRKRGVAIVLKQKGRNGRDSLLGNVDFILPYCEKKTD